MGTSLIQSFLPYLRPDSLSTLAGLQIQDLFTPQCTQETALEPNQAPQVPGKSGSQQLPGRAQAGGRRASPPYFRAAEGLCQNAAQGLEDQFNAIVYIERVAQLRIAAQFQQGPVTGAPGATGGSGEPEPAGEQQAFAFFAEVRVEELAQFEQRTSTVAEGLSGEQQQTFLAASQELRVRFEMSAQLSGVTLDGFATAAEKLKDDETALDRFLGLAKGLQDKADDLTERMFDLLDGLFKGNGDFNDLLDALLKEVSKMFEGLLKGQGAGSDKSQDGSVTISFQLEFEFAFSGSVQFSQEGVQQSDPILFDLDGDGFELTHYSKGAQFDILGSGQQVTTAFVTGGDAFLAIDRNGNGLVDSGLELFGDQRGARNGFEELRKLDSNGDGVVNAKDRDFDKLRLFRDNGNGVTEPGELVSLADAGIREVSLDYADVNQRAAGANRIAQTAWYRRIDETKGRAADAVLNYTV